LESDGGLQRQRVAQLHAVDHLLRLCGRLQNAPDPGAFPEHGPLSEVLDRMESLIALVHDGINGVASLDWLEILEQKSVGLTVAAEGVRARLLESDAIDGGVARALQLADALRSLERSAGHVQRVCHYLLAGRQEAVA